MTLSDLCLPVPLIPVLVMPRPGKSPRLTLLRSRTRSKFVFGIQPGTAVSEPGSADGQRFDKTMKNGEKGKL